MAKTVDISSKALVSTDAVGWAQWLTGDMRTETAELVANELQFVSRTTDVLLKVTSAVHGDHCVAIEFQFQHDPKMPRRMRAYAALVEERYGLPVYSVLINIRGPDNTGLVAHEYRSAFLGFESVHQYHVINLWELDAVTVAQGKLLALLPFVPVMRGGEDIDIIKQALYAIRSEPELADFETFLAFMAGLVLDRNVVRSFMRWDMAILRESPWYNEILQEGIDLGIEQGMEKGIEKGMEKGREGALLEAVAIALKYRFGAPDPVLVPRIQQLASDDLLALIPVIYTASSQQDVASFVDNLHP